MSDQTVAEEEVQAPAAPPTGPLQVSWAGIPKVNLLPLSVIEGRRFRRTQGVLGVALVGVVVLAGAGTFWGQHQVSAAQKKLDTAQAQVQSLNTDQAKYQAVPQIVAQVDAASEARATVMGTDVAWYTVLNDVAGAMPDGVTEKDLTFTLASTAAAAAPSSNPLSAVGIGSVNVAGEAGEYDLVATWLESLDKVGGIDSTALSSATTSVGADAGADAVDYTLTAVLTDQALTHRYDKKGS